MKKKPLFRIRSAVVFTAAVCMFNGCGNQPAGESGSLSRAPVVAEWKVTGSDSLLAGKTELLTDTLTLPLSQWLEDYRMIRLDNRDEALVQEGVPFITEHYIGIRCSSMPFKLFDREGNYLNDIGKIGQGPNEYSSTVYQAQIDEENDRVYLIGWFSNRQILVYDLKGNPYPPVPLAYQPPKMNFRVDLKGGTVTVGAMPFEGVPCPAAWVQDLQGNVLQEIPGEPHAVYPDFSNEIKMDFGNSYPSYYIWRVSPENDSLYEYRTDKKRLVPRFTMQLGGKDVPMHDYIETTAFFMGEITPGKIMTDQGYWIPKPMANFIVDKKSGKGAYVRVVNDLLDNSVIESPLYRIFGDYWVTNYDPGDLLDILEARLAAPEGLTEKQVAELQEMRNSITVDDNNILFIGKLKKDPALVFSGEKTFTPLKVNFTSRDKRTPKAPAQTPASTGKRKSDGTPPPPPPPPSR